jgi:hypothetical protein
MLIRLAGFWRSAIRKRKIPGGIRKLSGRERTRWPSKCGSRAQPHKYRTCKGKFNRPNNNYNQAKPRPRPLSRAPSTKNDSFSINGSLAVVKHSVAG